MLEIRAAVVASLFLLLQTALVSKALTEGQGEVKYEWVHVEFDWPSDDMRVQYEQDDRYDFTHNLISGVKSFRGQVYVTVPRLKYTTGVPSTLNMVVKRGNKHLLRPFPNWEAQELGNCNALQCAMSMEVDPITGYMYVIDPGRSGIFGNATTQPAPTICPPKLVVYDLKDGRLVRSHNFPEDVVSWKTNFLNDIVLDRGSPLSSTVRWVYITDAADSKLITFDMETNKTRAIYHPSMDFDHGDGSDIVVSGKTYKLKTPIDGLAMSGDFQFVYFCALGSKDLFQVSTRALRDEREDFASNVRYVGSKVSQTGGMTSSSDSLYYGALSKNGVYRWDMRRDKHFQGVGAADVVMNTQTELVQDDQSLQWPDSFTVDEYGYLWFSSCRAHLFLLGGIDFTGASGANFRIWRVNISERSYLVPESASFCQKQDMSSEFLNNGRTGLTESLKDCIDNPQALKS